MRTLDSGKKSTMRLQILIIFNLRAQRLALKKVPCGMSIATWFGSFKCVLDHGPVDERCHLRMLTFEYFVRRIQERIEIAIEFGVSIENKTSCSRMVGPADEKTKGCCEM